MAQMLLVRGYKSNNIKIMEVIVFDVGNASCNYICSPNKYAMMIDCGSCSEKASPVDVINDYISKGYINPAAYVSPEGIRYPMALLHITHPDDDHVRNADRVYKEMRPYLLKRTFTENFADADSINDDYKKKFDMAYRGPNHDIDFGFEVDATFSIPVEVVKNDNTLKNKVRNNNSIVRFISYNGIRFLFTGDLETAGWDWLIKNDPNFVKKVKDGVEVLIAPHHGHESGFPKALFDLIGKVEVIILSKDSEASKEESDVYSNYSSYAKGVVYVNRNDSEIYEAKVMTTRSNGNIHIRVDSEKSAYTIWADKASSNHTKI